MGDLPLIQRAFPWMAFSLTIGLSFLLCYNIRRGNRWWAAATIWLASPVPILGVGVGMEQRNVLDMLNPAKQALSALFGDLLVLPVVVWLMAYAVKQSANTTFTVADRWRWMWCWAVGCAGGLLFHLYDAPHYTRLAVNSPSKYTHDYLAWPAIMAGLLFGFIVVLRSSTTRKLGFMALGAFAIFLALMTLDTIAPHWNAPLHVQYDWNTGKVIPYITDATSAAIPIQT